ncbi:MAG: alpha-E domain-containing protein, partial [Advenella sp.]
HEQMTRDEGWSFLLLGRLIEKLGRMNDTLGFFLRQSEHDKTIMLESLLEIAYSIVTYRARYHREEEMLAVLYLLVFDRSNPYSLRYLCQSLLDNSAAFNVHEAQSRQILQTVVSDMDAIDLAPFVVGTPAAEQIYTQLSQVCADISYGLSIYANSISHQYFLVTDTISSDTGLETVNKDFL